MIIKSNSSKNVWKKDLQNNDAFYQPLAKALPINVYRIDLEGCLTFANRTLLDELGLPAEEVIGKLIYDFYPKEMGDKCRRDDDHVITQERTLHLTEESISPSTGERRYVELMKIPVYGLDEQVVGMEGLFWDITNRKHMEDELKHMATHDSLTGLYNRNMLEQRLNDEIHRAFRYNHALSVFMLDIDHFKSINDTYGHRIGDIVLRSIAKVLESSIRNADYVARYGGEEFVIVLPETALTKAEELAERLRNQIAKYPLQTEDDKEINLTASIGISTFPEHGQSCQDLLEVADSSMYAAKKAGRNQVKAPCNKWSQMRLFAT